MSWEVWTMQSKTSFFNKALFRVNLTRFSPLWILYTVFILVCTLMVITSETSVYYTARNMGEYIGLMAIVNLCYAFLTAQVLFGDLFAPRMCNALHAMPITRPRWFFVNTVCGILYSLVPNILSGLLSAVMLGTAASVAFWWLLASTMQYLFFFGLAAVSMMVVGNRIASLMVYGLTNFLSMVALWLDAALYTPMMFGIVAPDSAPFLLLCPVASMCQSEYVKITPVPASGMYTQIQSIELSEGWVYLTVCFLLGVALLGLALALYRKRRLECAGDFLAFPCLKWVFLVLFTVLGGCLLHIFTTAFNTDIPLVLYLFILVGMAVAYFIGLMLIQRQVNVFTLRAFARFGILAGVFVLTLALTYADAFGTVRYIPETDKVACVDMDLSARCSNLPYVNLTKGTDIDEIRQLQADLLTRSSEYREQTGLFDWLITGQFVQSTAREDFLNIDYKLKNGRVVSRSYPIDSDGAERDTLIRYFSTPESVLGVPEEQLPLLIQNIESSNFYSSGAAGTDTLFEVPPEGLLEAIIADCHAGTMTQSYAFHMVSDDRSRFTVGSFGIQMTKAWSKNNPDWLDVSIWPDCENTVRWLTENGLYDPVKAAEEMAKEGEIGLA